MVSRKNIKYKMQQDAKRVPHYGIRKLSIGVASVLLGTVFYMQNGSVHADVNPTVSAGNVDVVNKDFGTSGSAGASSTLTGVDLTNSGVGSVDSASSVVSAGDTTNSAVPSQVSGSSVEGATKQANNAALTVSQSESSTPASQVNAAIDNSNSISSLPPASHHQVSADGGNPINEQLSTNLSLSVNQKLNANISSLLASKVALTGSNNAVNGGFDEATWGKLDVNAWKGSVQGDYYQLTDYTGDANHVIVPNEADFAKAGISTAGKQVGVTSDLMHTIFRDKTTAQDATVAFSKTDNKIVKAIDANWVNTWGDANDYVNGLSISSKGKLTKFDGTNLDVSNVIDMSRMFTQNKLTDLSGISNWKTGNVTNMTGMFSGNQISDLTPLSNWKTDNVTSMHGIFSDNQISNLTPLVNWKTDNVTDMSYMFNKNQISDLAPLSNWKTNNVTDMSYMFDYNQISDLTPLANWKTDNVTNMDVMFYRNQIAYADFTKWNFGKVQNLHEFIIQGSPAIIIVKNADQTLLSRHLVISTKQNQLHFGSYTVDMPTVYVVSDKADARQKILADIKAGLADYQKFYADADADIKPVKPLDQLTNLVDLANAKFTVKHPLSELDTNDAFALNPANGLHEHKNVNDNGGYDTDFWGTLDVSKFTTVKNGDNLEITGYTGDASKVIIPNIADFWTNGLDQGAKQVTISSILMHTLAKNATRIGLSKTNNQKVVASDSVWQDAFGGLTNAPNTSSNANGGMWVYNPNLMVMDLHNLDTTNITDMGAMFNGGRNLKVVGDLSQWNVANVADMRNIFQSASSLTNIGDLDNWNTSKVTDMTSMFGQASKLTNIGDLSKWDVSKVTNMHAMFGLASSLLNIGNLSNWDTSKVTDMSFMFNQTSKLENIGDLSKWNVSNVTNMSTMFQSASSLTNIGDLDSWDTSKVTDMSYMFNQASALANIGDLSKWDTAKVTDMSFMFDQASKLTNVGDLSKWNVANVTDMKTMFELASSLTNIGNLDNWNTAKVTDMSYMFNGVSELQSLGDLSKWNTSKVTNMAAMFNGASKLQNLGNLDDWDVSNVTNMIGMFQLDSNLTNIGDLSKWNTSKVTNMSYMFNGTSELQSLGNLNDWDTSNVTDMSWMFRNATDLTNIGNLDNWNTSKVTDMSYMFYYATRLTNIGDLSKWQTGNVTNIAYMFVSTNTLRRLNISNWDLTKLANKDSMKYMFANDTDLTIIANDLALPVWYQNEINDADYFWNHHIAVITNVPELIRATGDIDSLKIDNQDASRSIFYDSRGSSDAIQVLKDANQAYIKQYQNEHPGYTLTLAADVDQTDPIALANARFVSAPREVQFTIAYYDLTGKIVSFTTSTHKVGDTVSISPVAPDNYVLADGQLSMNYLIRWGLNEANFFIEPKLTTTAETKTVSRTIKVQTPDGQTNNVVQTVTFVRNSYLNQVTKQITYSPWSFGGQYQFSGYQPKPMAGYTADVIPAVIVTPDSLNTTVNVAYHKIPVVYSVDYQLANGTVVKNVSMTPERDGTIHLTAPQGYHLLTTATDVQVGSSSQKLTVLVLPDEQTYTAYSALPSSVTEPLTKTITRTINITMPNGRVRRIVQQVHFVRTATVAANGKITYSDWTGVGQTSFDRLFVPKRRGYRLVMTDKQGQTLTGVNQLVVDPTMDDAVINVKYIK